MPRIAFLATLLLAVAATSIASAADPKWSIKADYVDSCSCNPACPCMFGSPPTHKNMCQGATLLDIEKGSYDGIDLAGIKILVVYHGGRWMKVLVSDNASREQLDAAKRLVPDVSAFFATAKVVEVNRVKISVEKTADKVEVTAPGTHLEIVPMKGANGKQIKLENMPPQGFDGPALLDFAQYSSVEIKHQSKDEKFKYSGTNGFTAHIDASSEAAEPEKPASDAKKKSGKKSK